MRYFLLFYIFAIVAVIGVFGFRGQTSEKTPLRIFPDMDEQARYKPQGYTDYHADKAMDRPEPVGTVATIPAHLKPHAVYEVFVEDDYVLTGKIGESYGKTIPATIPVDGDLMQLGKEKYEIFCSSCHGITGDGNGVTKKYGMLTTPSYFDQRLIDTPVGQIYETINVGKGLMGPYGAKLRIKERWAIVAYVRALQTARNASIDDVPQQFRNTLK